jgi:hypothetical protein
VFSSEFFLSQISVLVNTRCCRIQLTFSVLFQSSFHFLYINSNEIRHFDTATDSVAVALFEVIPDVILRNLDRGTYENKK